MSIPTNSKTVLSIQITDINKGFEYRMMNTELRMMKYVMKN